MVFQEQFSIATRGHGDMHDLTEAVAEIVRRSRIRSGIVHVFNVGSTAAVSTIEFEPGLLQDLYPRNAVAFRLPCVRPSGSGDQLRQSDWRTTPTP
jgi:thiamine phosphate synthase YjbQ (UPF0047 family)